jgi:uncharacterized OsmC-like protein
MDPKTQSVHTVTWNGDNIFVARNVSGIEAKMQGSSKEGLPNTYVSPIDYFISALGSCPGIEIQMSVKIGKLSLLVCPAG